MMVIPLDQVEDTQVWGATGGGAAGSAIMIFAGKKTLRPEPISNECLSDELQNYDPDITLYIGYLPWIIIDKEGTEICDWDMTSDHDNNLLNECIQILIGQSFLEVDTSDPEITKFIFSYHIILVKNIDKSEYGNFWRIKIGGISYKLS